LQPVPLPPAPAAVIYPDAMGNLILSAAAAELHGDHLQLETQGGLPDIGYWTEGGESVSWTAHVARAGSYKVSATLATLNADGSFVVEVAGEKINAQAPVTGGWDKFQTIELGSVQIKSPGDVVVKVGAKDSANWKAINLNSVRLTPID
jgi:hypothetical protein